MELAGEPKEKMAKEVRSERWLFLNAVTTTDSTAQIIIVAQAYTWNPTELLWGNSFGNLKMLSKDSIMRCV